MTKPITAVLALQLWEEGAFALNEPVHRFIPAFRDTKVWRSGTAEAPELEPLAAPMRMWHLFTHMSGLTYGFMRSHSVDALYREAGFDFGLWRATANTPSGSARRARRCCDTAFWVDPVDQLVVQFFTQLLPSRTHPIRSELRQLLSQALLD